MRASGRKGDRRFQEDGHGVKVSHDPETDMMYIEFEDRPSLESFELFDGVVVDLDADEHVVGIEIEDASRKLDIEQLRAALESKRVPRPA